MWAEGGGGNSCRKPQFLPGKSEGPAERTTSNRPCGTWPDGPSTTLLTETELSSGGELDVDNVDEGGTYLGAGRLHPRDMRRLLHGRPTGTYNTY